MPRPDDALLTHTTLNFCDHGLIKRSTLNLKVLA